MKRNKVMSFGGHSPYPVETARPFMVIRVIMAPPLALNRVNVSREVYKVKGVLL